MKIKNWVDERKMEPRWSNLASSLINIVLMIAVFLILWRVFMDPRGYLRMYTPMYGYAYVQWFLVSVLVVQLIFKFWPLQDSNFLAKKHPLVKGSVLLGISVIFCLFMVNGVLKNFLGNIAVPYFSEETLLALKQNAFNAREYSHQAIVMFGGLMGMIIPIWVLHMDNWPAKEIPRPGGHFTSLIMVFLFTALGFSFLYHPHFGVLFYPWQEFTAALPWWENLANTLSGNFNLGLMMCWSSALWFVQVTCEGYPFKLIPRQPWRGIAGIIGTFILGLAFFTGFHFLQEVVWGAPVRGAKLIAAVDWRYLHSGEIALFLLLVYLVWGFYFKNWPRKFSTEVNIFVRTVIVGVGTLLFYLFYYKFNAQILGQQAGYSSPMQFPLAATSLIATLTLAHSWFFDMWPGEKVTNRQDFIEKDKLVVEVKKQVNN